MSDIALRWNNETQTADILMDGPDLVMDDGMETAVILSLFTDARAAKDDQIPDGSDDRRGFWGDAFDDAGEGLSGSRLWLLERCTITAENLRRWKDYAQEALAWMLRIGVAKSIDVAVVRIDVSAVSAEIKIYKPNGKLVTFNYIWKALK